MHASPMSALSLFLSMTGLSSGGQGWAIASATTPNAAAQRALSPGAGRDCTEEQGSHGRRVLIGRVPPDWQWYLPAGGRGGLLGQTIAPSVSAEPKAGTAPAANSCGTAIESSLDCLD